jgi:SAM-dependent methyltransferase
LDQVVSPVIQALGSVTALPFKAASFDGVILSETLEHVPRPQLALAEVVRTLQPHGWLYLTTPQMWPLHYEPHDYFRFTRYGLTYLLEEAGLREVTLQPLGGLYTYLFTRLGEKFIKLLVNLLGWLPRPQRWFVAGVLGLPLQYLFYLLSFWLDRLAPKDVLGWAVVARKGPGRLEPSSPKK